MKIFILINIFDFLLKKLSIIIKILLIIIL